MRAGSRTVLLPGCQAARQGLSARQDMASQVASQLDRQFEEERERERER